MMTTTTMKLLMRTLLLLLLPLLTNFPPASFLCLVAVCRVRLLEVWDVCVVRGDRFLSFFLSLAVFLRHKTDLLALHGPALRARVEELVTGSKAPLLQARQSVDPHTHNNPIYAKAPLLQARPTDAQTLTTPPMCYEPMPQTSARALSNI